MGRPKKAETAEDTRTAYAQMLRFTWDSRSRTRPGNPNKGIPRLIRLLGHRLRQL